MRYIIIGLYLFLILLNWTNYMNGRENRFVEVLSFILLLVLMCGTAGIYDGSSYDLSNYKAQYEHYNPLEDENFGFYYLFFLCMRAGQNLGLEFTRWWMIMTIISLLIIKVALNKFDLSRHAFLFFFMIYYVFVLYTGLKAYYGFVIFLLAFGFLLKGGTKNKLIYCLLVCVAGGFHVMYYTYLLFAIIGTSITNRDNQVIKYLCGASLALSVVLRISGSANTFLANIFAFVDSDKVDSYLTLNTNMGFYIPVIIQLLCLLHVYNYRRLATQRLDFNEQQVSTHADILFYTGLLTIMFYPLFMVSITFMRLLTYFSCAAICYTCTYHDEFDFFDRKMIFYTAMIVIAAYYFRQFVLGNMWENSVLPFFNSRFF